METHEAQVTTKTRRHDEVDEEVDGRVKHHGNKADEMCGKEDAAVATVRAEFWDSESCQRQGHVRSRAEDEDAGHHHQHPYQHCLTFQI